MKHLNHYLFQGALACALAITGANAQAQETATTVTAIDILLKPDATMVQHATTINDRLRKDYPKGFSLDASHRPHISLAQRYVRTKELPKVYAAVGKVLGSANVTGLKLEAYKYYYIPVGDLGLQGIVVKPTPELLKLQKAVIDAVTPFALKTGTAAAFVPPTDGSVIDPQVVEYVRVFVPEHSGEHYLPHVTTGLASKADLDKMAAELFASFTFSPEGAAVYHLGEWGTAAEKLKQLDLKPLALAPAEDGGRGGAGPTASASDDQEALAKAAQNPIAAMISVPFQNNFNFGIGPNNAMQYNLNVQPVIPISLSEDWNLITRTIIPTINQPSPAPGVRSAFGLGDINPQFYFSPAKPGGLIWGVGPTFTFPTATDSMLGTGEWSAGPAAVALTIQGHWVVGAVVNQQWSFAGWGSKNVNSFLVQPFVNYNLPHGWYLVSSPIMTADWEAASSDRWTVPLGGGVGKIFKLGKQAFNATLQAYDNVVTPNNGADWQLRFQIQLLFPK